MLACVLLAQAATLLDSKCGLKMCDQKRSAVRYATTNEYYNEEFLSIKAGCHNERGGILSADIARACA